MCLEKENKEMSKFRIHYKDNDDGSRDHVDVHAKNPERARKKFMKLHPIARFHVLKIKLVKGEK